MHTPVAKSGMKGNHSFSIVEETEDNIIAVFDGEKKIFTSWKAASKWINYEIERDYRKRY